ncbi:MAG: hypothetical protein VYC17_06630, partial [Nitrospinota bacterium]|nr:hypothetical protein [Nitrospinota bacterium]
DWFEQVLTKLSAADVHYYRDGGRDIIQFLDPAALVAFTRGFKTEYRWKLGFEDRSVFAQGNQRAREGGHGAVKIDLRESAGKEVPIPFGEKLVLDLDIRRSHPKNFKIFNATSTRIRFVVQPWFDYEGPRPPKLKKVYPLGLLFLNKEE